MSSFELRFEDPGGSGSDPRRSFFWTATESSTIDARLVSAGRIGPRLGHLGPVPDGNVDLARIAVAVFAADRSLPRAYGGSDWNRRPIHVTVPVLDPAPWAAAADELKAVIDLLSGDDWSFRFVADHTPDEQTAKHDDHPQRVVLLSGGADSAIGALRSSVELPKAASHTLASHYTTNSMPALQSDIAGRIAALVPGAGQRHVKAKLSRVAKDASGAWFNDERSQRSRSLLFLALGLAVAAIDGVPVWIPENGFASLNPPLGPERLGAISTRTTHPTFLRGLSNVLGSVGAHGVIVNPFATMTKGEMFRWTADEIGDDEASELLSATHSCAHTDLHYLGISTKQSCGVCFGCVVRRASFLAAGVEDRTPYVDAAGDPKVKAWLEGKSIIESVRRFAVRGVRARDLIAIGLPDDYSIADAHDLCQRGVEELRALVA